MHATPAEAGQEITLTAPDDPFGDWTVTTPVATSPVDRLTAANDRAEALRPTPSVALLDMPVGQRLTLAMHSGDAVIITGVEAEQLYSLIAAGHRAIRTFENHVNPAFPKSENAQTIAGLRAALVALTRKAP